jgi:hypothetical protein
VRRAALTPNPAPAWHDGQPMDRPVELALGSASVVHTAAPTSDGGDGGVVVPRYDVNGGVRARVTKDFDIGLLYDQGLNQGAEKTASDMPRPVGDTYGGGLSLHYSAGDGPLRWGLEANLLVYSVPWTETWTCVKDCGGTIPPQTFTRDGRETVPVGSFSVIPSWRTGSWVLYGSMTLRNHPTIDKGDVLQIEIDSPVDAGPINMVVAGGAEVALGGGVKAQGQIYMPLTGDPVRYSPTVALGLIVGLGE